MSDIESYKGKLIPVDCGELSLEEKFQEITGASTLPKGYDNWVEYLEFIHDDKYFFDIDSGILYKVEKENLDLDYFALGKKNSDGSYDFAVSFYNGTSFLSEALSEAVDNAHAE